ncbi:MAG: NCAIR mutase (PurE)-related protein [Myxococcota bacterium]|jgi:NCAIR mutase (PurE)-related protein
MDRDGIKRMLEGVKQGDVDVAEAMKSLTNLPFIDTPNARVDTQRSLRMGIPEVVYGPGKTVGHIIEVVTALQSAEQTVLVTRLEADVASEVLETIPSGDYDAQARTLWFGPAEVPVIGKGTIAIISAGTSDYFVAAEAAAVARRFGNKVETLVDVGVAGIHRLLASQDVLQNARVLIVVAGMEGALPSVVGGLVDKPVIAVPTSVGYGAALGGVAALLGMLTSCASNVTVVNIDNGFGAAYVATLINRL